MCLSGQHRVTIQRKSLKLDSSVIVEPRLLVNLLAVRVRLAASWSKWRPSAHKLRGYVKMSLTRICAFSKCLFRRSVFQRRIQRVTNVDYCHLCFAIRNGPVRQISGTILQVTTLGVNQQPPHHACDSLSALLLEVSCHEGVLAQSTLI